MTTTKTWVESLGVESDTDLSPVADCSLSYERNAQEVAIRAVILQGIVAVAYRVEARPIIEWFHAQGIWNVVTPQEQAFLTSSQHTESECLRFRWHQEAEWTLLWMIGRVESLGLPTQCCDTRRLADEIIPALGDDLRDFISKSLLHSPGAFLAEADRSYNLWCYALAAQRRKELLPSDLNLRVLYERRYAFEWMDGFQEWDKVTCDA